MLNKSLSNQQQYPIFNAIKLSDSTLWKNLSEIEQSLLSGGARSQKPKEIVVVGSKLKEFSSIGGSLNEIRLNDQPGIEE